MRNSLLVMFGILLFPGASIAAPMAKVLLPIHQFGTVSYGQVVKHEFHVKNEGETALRIQSASSKCPCITADFDKLIAPGATGRLRITMDTSALDGNERHLVLFKSNDPVSPNFSVALEGFVRGPVIVLPRDRFALKGFLGQAVSQTIHLENNSRRPLKIAKVSSNNAAFQTTLATTTAGQKYQIDVQLDPKAPVGDHITKIVVQTNSKERPTLEIPMVVLIQSAIQIRPNVIYINAEAGAKKTVKETIALRHLQGRNFHLTDVKSNFPGTQISQSPLKDGGFELSVRVPLAGLSQGWHRHEIAIRTDSPDAPSLKIPLSIRIN